MCCKDKQGNESVTVIQGACQSGAREMCGCEEKQGHHAVPMPHGVHHAQPHGMCGCHKSSSLSKEEQIEMLEGYRESLKCELKGVEDELKEIKG